MQHFVYTEAGHSHRNEDTVGVCSHPDDPTVLICALADGQGGRGGGAEASRLAVTQCLEAASTYSVRDLLDTLVWSEMLTEVDAAVEAEADGGWTTLIGLCVTQDQVCGASCGDSAAQLIQGNHSILLTDFQQKEAIGSGAAFPIAFESALPQEWKLLLMSDGVWRYIGHEAIGELSTREQGQSLIFGLRQMQRDHNSGQLPDDFSLILVQAETMD